MKQTNKHLCVILASMDMSLKIKALLKDLYSVSCKPGSDRAIFALRNHLVSCIIIHVDSSFPKWSVELFHLKHQFPAIPKIALIADHDLELARLCGEAGIDFVVSDMQKLVETTQLIVCRKNSKVSVAELGIDLNQCSPQVMKAITIIEKMYLQLTNVQEVSDLMGISECTLSEYFRRCCPVGPKKLLTLLKIKHAVYLMENPGLSLKEIAKLVGYSNQSRFNECFHRIMRISPGEYRKMAKKT